MRNFCAQPVQTEGSNSSTNRFFAHSLNIALRNPVHNTAVFTKDLHSNGGFLPRVMPSFIQSFTDGLRYFYTLYTDLVLTITTYTN